MNKLVDPLFAAESALEVEDDKLFDYILDNGLYIGDFSWDRCDRSIEFFSRNEAWYPTGDQLQLLWDYGFEVCRVLKRDGEEDTYFKGQS